MPLGRFAKSEHRLAGLRHQDSMILSTGLWLVSVCAFQKSSAVALA
jgi:hypothetical protein